MSALEHARILAHPLAHPRAPKMAAELVRLQQLSLVGKVCQELQNHLGIDDKDLAEFVIHLAKDCTSPTEYHATLQSNGADFSTALASSIFNLITAMDPERAKKERAAKYLEEQKKVEEEEEKELAKDGRPSAKKFFGLAIPDSSPMQIDDATSSSATSSARGEKRRREDNDVTPYGAAASSSSSTTAARTPFPYRQGPSPTIGDILEGEVRNIKEFGAFVELRGYAQPSVVKEGQRPTTEGLLHASQIQKQKVLDISSVLKRGQKVKVKITAIVGNKISVSMKEVDQQTGADLKPTRLGGADDLHTNPSRPTGFTDAAAARARMNAEDLNKRSGKRLSSPERWEMNQLIAGGAMTTRERPDLDDEHGLVHSGRNEDEQDEVEVEINDVEPRFLEGQTAIAANMSPIKSSLMPEGSLQRAALTQSALSKERRELREQQKTEQLDAVPMDLARSWEDPMTKPGDRHLAADLRNVGMQNVEQIPAWKLATQGKNVTYGRATTMTIKEQRESLPIYKLRDQLLEAVNNNQVLVVIGETGSG